MKIPCPVEKSDVCIALIETSSIAKGLEVTDCMLKAAPVELIYSSPTSPGHYLVLISGDVESVRSALQRGEEKAADSLRDSLFLPHVHQGVLDALYRIVPWEEEDLEAIGVLEGETQASLLAAADRARKAAEVHLVHIHLGIGIGGHSFVIFVGPFEEVEVALEEGREFLESRKVLREWVLIGNADPTMAEVLLSAKLPQRSQPS